MKLKTLLLASVVFAAATPAFADDAAVMKRLDDMQRMIEQQQKQISDQNAEISTLKQALGGKQGKKVVVVQRAGPPSKDMQNQLAAQQVQIDRLAASMDAVQSLPQPGRKAEASATFQHGKPLIVSDDGRFSLAIRMLTQFDAAHYLTSFPRSGTNFRRAQIGLQGTVGDWSYFFNADFGGQGAESPGHIQSAYVEYDGLRPLALRIGAYPPPLGLEDSTASSDTLFLERAAPSDVIRNAIGGDGRVAASIIYAADDLFASISLTGSKVGTVSAGSEQSAIATKLAGPVYEGENSRLVLSATSGLTLNVTSLLDGSELLFGSPELTVSSTQAVFGPDRIRKATFFGTEAGWQYDNFFVQGGYFAYWVQRIGMPNVYYNGSYGEVSWVLTGESHGYSAQDATFTSPKPDHPFSLEDGTWGAWEIAMRYDDTNMNWKPISTRGSVGGDQTILTLGLNWYPNDLVRFMFDYQNAHFLHPERVASPMPHLIPNSDLYDALSLRAQISY